MSTIEQLASMLVHLEWANTRVLQALTSQPELAIRSDALRLFTHVLGSERVWYARIQGDPELNPPWPGHTLADLESELAHNVADLNETLSGLVDSDLDREIVYRTTAGVEHRCRLGDILTHVALHGAYHRGQIALVLRQGAGEPVSTDYIKMIRES